MTSRTLTLGASTYPLVLPNTRDPRLHVAAVIITMMTSGRTTPSSCFRISLLPHTGWPWAQRVSFFKLASRFGLANLYSRRRDPLHNIYPERFPQPVLKILFEHNRIDVDLQHVPVEHGIVLPQKISFV